LINISFFIAYHSFNKSEKRKVKKRKYDQTRIAAQSTPWKQKQDAGLSIGIILTKSNRGKARK
jgi:hypothetical protein